jgi:carbon monoxide dehydrogenase subunit G
MKMSGSQVIRAPRKTVWRGLNDPKILQQCIPGCETIKAASPTEMSAKVVLKVGPVKATFTGEVTLSDIKAPESYRISGKGQGGLAGFATGGASVKLTENSAIETLMDYDVDAQIGGKLAMLGSRLIDSTAKSLAEQFFTKFAGLMMKQAQSPALVAKAKSAKKPAASTKAKKPTPKKPASRKTRAKKNVPTKSRKS